MSITLKDAADATFTTATDVISTVHYQVVKLGVGADGTAVNLAPATNALNSTGAGIPAVQLVGQFDDTTPTSITENQFGNLRMSANRNLFVTIRDAAGNERGLNIDASNRLLVDNASWLGSTAPTIGSKTSANCIPVVIASDQGALQVAAHNVTNAGNFLVQDSEKIADDAAFTVGTTKVMPVGRMAVSHGADPDVADASDAGIALMNRHRIPFSLGGHPNLQSSEYITTTQATDDNIMPLISAGTKYVITGITVTASAANAANVSVRIGFGATTIPTQGTSQADAVAKVVLSHPNIAPGSGVVKGHAGGIVGIGGDGEELRISTGGAYTVVVQVDWFTIPT